MAVNDLPKSYRHLVDDKIFLDDKDNNLAPEIFRTRYKNLFFDIQTLLEKCGLDQYCTVNAELLWKATLDYFEDVARLKNNHRVKHTRVDKIISFEVFWLLRNHPIQIDKPDEIDDKYVHINEYIFSFLFIKMMITNVDSKFKANIQIDDLIGKFEENELSDDFRKKLYYTFRFRTYTAQSLLLLYEGFMTAAEFTMQVT